MAMKSWKKLKELTGFRDKTNHAEDVDEISKGMQDVQDMKLRYEGLHAVSSRVAGRAYGFSEAIQELANFLVNTFGLVDESGEIGQVFKEISRAQVELSKVLHNYAYHVSETLSLPTANLLNELDNIQVQKRQYDQKRHTYERLRRSKVKNGRLEEAKEQFDELAMFLGCRLHSLEQGRPRNLLTQATRHHAAQINVFRQCLAILEDLDPYMNRIVQERNLDQTMDYLDGEANVHEDIKKHSEDFDQLSSSSGRGSPKHYVDDPRIITYGAPAGSRSAPISPLRFTETNGINSIQEVIQDGKFTPFTRTNSWMRRKGDPAPRKPPNTTSSQHQKQNLQWQEYSVTEPAASPARNWTKIPDEFIRTKPEFIRPKPRGSPEVEFNRKTPEFNDNNSRTSSSPLKPAFPSLQRHFSAGGGSSNNKQPRILIPNSGPLPQPLQHHSDPLYKSGPLNPTPKISPTSSPKMSPHQEQQVHHVHVNQQRLSPPKVSELHKLPPPPLAAKPVIPYSAPLVRPSTGSSISLSAAAALAASSGSNSGFSGLGYSTSSTSGLLQQSQASPLPPPPLTQSSFSGQLHQFNKQRLMRKNEERVSPLPM